MSNGEPTWSAWKECRKHWRAFLLVAASSMLLAAIVVAGIPKEYSAQVKIADEHKDTDLLLGLNSFQSWAKTAMKGHHGIRLPEAYHKLVMTRDFAEEMSRVKVEGYGMDYYHYTLEHYERPWWKNIFRHQPDSLEEHAQIIDIINKRIRAKSSITYGTTDIQVTDNDPVVAAMMVDSVRAHLQQHMSAFSRQTALYDLETAKVKATEAESRYKTARDEYSHYVDTHNDPLSGIPSSAEDQLLKEYEAAFSAYEKACNQLIRAQALVDKFSFTFVVLTNATVPRSPTSPSQFGYVLSFMFIGLVLTAWVVLGRRKYQEITHR